MSARRAILGGRLIVGERIVDGHALLLRDGVIEAILPDADLPHDAARADVAGAFVTPGLIDVHTHGALGRSYLDGDDEAFDVNLREQARHGVTGVLATTSTASLEAIVAALARTRARMAAALPPGQARLLGAHVEGPYFAAAQAGAQDPQHLRTPDDGSAAALLAYDDVIRIVSFAPELPGAADLTRELVARGIVAAAGHAQATDADLASCRAWGMSHAIHLWSGQSTTVRVGAYRVPGLLEASLASDDLTGEVIADGHHLPPTLLRLAVRAFTPERLLMVSDTTSGAGLPAGSPFTMGGMRYRVGDGVGMMEDGSAFAGSTTFLDGMLRVMVERVGVSLPHAILMASRNPARLLGLARKGRLVPGCDADLALFTPDLTPISTLIAGRVVAGDPLEGVFS
jgi:N-acetylglucosamine-6-phosphate deacetylase